MRVEDQLDFLSNCEKVLKANDCGAASADDVIVKLLKVRGKTGALVPMRPNRVQREFAKRCGKRNIVLKARQLGITTYVAARFFVETILHPGTLTVQVAHDQSSAEQIFRIVHRFLANLPESLRRGALVTSRSNVRQIVFPLIDSEYRVETAADPDAGRGLTIQNLHCSEVARWPRNAAETLSSLRAAVPESGTVILESTPSGSGGVFYDEWHRAELKTHMRWLIGTGNEGKMQEVEERVQKHEAYLQRMGGIGAAFGVLLTLIHVMIDYLKVHH